MDSRLKWLIALRWIQWVLGAVAFGICLVYFVLDVTFYIYIPAISRAQFGLAGAIHVYLYLSAIWISVKPQGPLIWAILDIIFAMLAAAAAGTGQPSLSTYCSGAETLTLFWSESNLAYMQEYRRPETGTSIMTMLLERGYLQKTCGFNIGVVVVNAILIIMFGVTTFMQFKQYRENRQGDDRHLTPTEKHSSRRNLGWGKRLSSRFSSHRPLTTEEV